MDLDGYPVRPPPLPLPVVFDQEWRDVTFLHWPVRLGDVADLFPRGTRPDVFDGLTYVALVPFVMRRAGIRPGWPVPYFGNFPETNVRLYSVDAEGRHGVYFRSLDTARLAIVPFARAALGIPYAWSRMRVSRSGDEIRYDSTRRLPQRGLRSRITVRVGDRVDPTPLETWLTARWGAHARWAGRTVWVPNQHEPWPFHAADVLPETDDLVTASGVPPCGAPLRALFSPGVHAQFGRPALVRR